MKVRSVHWTPTGFSCLHGSAAKLSLSLADSPILSWLVETAAPGLNLKFMWFGFEYGMRSVCEWYEQRWAKACELVVSQEVRFTYAVS